MGLLKNTQLGKKIIGIAEKRGGTVSGLIDQMREQSLKNLATFGCSIEVYSAIRDGNIDFNATDELIQLSELLNQGEVDEANQKAQYIKNTTTEIIKKNYKDFEKDTGLHKLLDQQFGELFSAIQEHNQKDKLLTENDYSIGKFSVMGFGEILRAKIQVYLLLKEEKEVVYLDTTDLKDGDEKIQNIGELLSLLKNEVVNILGGSVEGKVLVAPGYVANLLGGINGMFARGFTDPITGLISLCLFHTELFDEVVFELQKDVDGLMSTNPKDLKNGKTRAQLIREISIDLALQLFGLDGAASPLANETTFNKFIIEALRNNENFTVKICNPANENDSGTYIRKTVESELGKVQIISSRSDVPDRYKHGLGTQGVNSLYLIGEDLGLLKGSLITQVGTLLSGEVKGVNYYVKSGINPMLIINFNDDYNPIEDKKNKLHTLKGKKEVFESEDNFEKVKEVDEEIEKLHLEFKIKLTNFDPNTIYTADEKHAKALDVLHRELIENTQQLAEAA